MKEPIFRRIKKEELDALLDLYAQLHSKDDPLPPRDKLQKLWDSIMANPVNNYFVLEAEGKIASTCVLTIVPNLTRGARPYGLVENVVTRVEYRTRGFGTTMLKHILQYAWEQRCYKVMLLTGSKDPAVFRFYEKAGFKQGIKTGFIATPPP
nr:GNAT family N-acetyltransferase [Candidatus Sigynarchaeota archaeon]